MCPNIPGKCPKELLCDIIGADGVFECKKKLVVFLDHRIALQVARSTICWAALFPSTLAKHIHLDVEKSEIVGKLPLCASSAAPQSPPCPSECHSWKRSKQPALAFSGDPAPFAALDLERLVLAKGLLVLEDFSSSCQNLGTLRVVGGNLEGSEEGRSNHMGEPGPSPAGKSLSG